MRYEEASGVHQSKIAPSRIVQYQDVCWACKQLCEHLTFKRKTVLEAMVLLANEFGDQWKLTEQQKQDWVATMTDRLLNMLSALRMSEKKKVPPKWLSELKWHAPKGNERKDKAKDRDVAINFASEGQAEQRQEQEENMDGEQWSEDEEKYVDVVDQDKNLQAKTTAGALVKKNIAAAVPRFVASLAGVTSCAWLGAAKRAPS